MEGKYPAARATPQHGSGAIYREIPWPTVCILEYVSKPLQVNSHLLIIAVVGWTRFMQWKYPVEVVVQNPTLFKGTGAAVAAASL